MFEFIQAILTRIPKIPCFSNNLMASKHLKTTMFISKDYNTMLLKSREVFERHTRSKSWVITVFVEFSSLGSLGFCLRAWPLPRPHTNAPCCRGGPRLGRRAASRGQGSGGGEQHGPWPRTKDLKGDPCEEVLEVLIQFKFSKF